MSDERKTKRELIGELDRLRRRVKRLEAAGGGSGPGTEQFRQVYEDSPIAIELYDARGRLVEANRACLELFGVEDAAAVRGFSLFDDPNVDRKVKERLRRGRTVRYEASFDFEKVKEKGLYETSRSGVIHLDVLITPLRGPRGGNRGYLVQVQDVTKRTLAERSLREANEEMEQRVEVRSRELAESERRYRDLVELTTDIIYASDAEGNQTFMNEVAFRLLEASPEEVIGKPWSRWIHPEDRERSFATFTEMVKRGVDIFDFENRYVSKSGREIPVVHNVRVLRDERGTVVGTQGTARNMAAYKTAEEALQETNRRLETLVDAIPDLVFFKDGEGRHVMVNRAVCEVLGVKPEDLAGRTAEDLMPPEAAEQCRASDEGTLAGGVPVRQEEHVHDKDGNLLCLDTIKVPLYDEEGKAVGLVGISRDVTERRRMEEALRESEERYRRIMETANDAVFIADAETGVIVDCNVRACEMLGAERDDIIGMHQSGLHPKEAREEYRRGFKKSMQMEKNVAINRAVRQRDGGIVWVDISASRFEMGGRRYSQGIFRDVTERRQLEEELRQSLGEKELLMREVHHRVKNNLAVVSSLLRLQSRTIEDEEVRGLISDSGNRVQSLSLLHEKLYRSEDMTTVAMGEYVNELAEQLFRAFGTDDGEVRLAVDAEDAALDVDAAIPCGLIVNELLTNALKHAFPDGRTGEVRVGFRRNGQRGYELSVHDDGAGMAPEVDPWKAGTMGMQIVAQLAAQLGGSLELEREGGTGWTIHFEEREFD